MESRPYEFSIIFRCREKGSLKVTFYSAKQWPEHGGRDGAWRLKVGRPKKDKPGEFSECWWPRPREYKFLTSSRAWELVAELTLQDKPVPAPITEIPRDTLVRVPNGNILAGEVQYDLTRTATEPVRLDDGRDYVVVLMVGQGLIHVPVDNVIVLRR